MVAQIRKLRRIVVPVLLCALATSIVSCATQQQDARLVSDPDDRGTSAIPWNKQEQWEVGGQFANMTDRR